MEQSKNIKLLKQLSSERYDVSTFNKNADILDEYIFNLVTHSNNNNVHVSIEDKKKWDELLDNTIISNQEIDALFSS